MERHPLTVKPMYLPSPTKITLLFHVAILDNPILDISQLTITMENIFNLLTNIFPNSACNYKIIWDSPLQLLKDEQLSLTAVLLIFHTWKTWLVKTGLELTLFNNIHQYTIFSNNNGGVLCTLKVSMAVPRESELNASMEPEGFQLLNSWKNVKLMILISK